MLTRARGGCVVRRCQNKNPRENGWPVDVNDVMHRKRAQRILGDLKKSQWVEFCLGRRRLASFTRRSQASGLVAGATRVGGWAGGNVIIESLCNSVPYVNSKVIKSFVPELRSRYVFFVFRESYVICIYVMNIICTFHISVSGYAKL